MDALVREIGTRGRADAVVAAVAGASPPSDSALPGLRSLALRELRQRAEAAGIERDLIEDARDEDDPKAAVLALLLEHEAEDIAKGRQLAEEQGKLGLRELRARAVQADVDDALLEDARDADEPKLAIIALIVGSDSAM